MTGRHNPNASAALKPVHIERILERAGLRPTLRRTMVLEFFHAHAHDHFSAEQLYKLLNDDAGNVSLATLYRVLGQLVEARLVSSVTIGDGRVVYELDDGEPHDHIVCTQCGHIDEFFDAQIEERQRHVAQSRDFQVSGRQLVVFGVCAECRKRRATTKWGRKA